MRNVYRLLIKNKFYYRFSLLDRTYHFHPKKYWWLRSPRPSNSTYVSGAWHVRSDGSLFSTSEFDRYSYGRTISPCTDMFDVWRVTLYGEVDDYYVYAEDSYGHLTRQTIPNSIIFCG